MTAPLIGLLYLGVAVYVTVRTWPIYEVVSPSSSPAWSILVGAAWPVVAFFLIRGAGEKR